MPDEPQNGSTATDIEAGSGRSAPQDPIIAERLGSPGSPRDIYLEEASVYRPIATGDVFCGVAVPGATEDEASFGLTMLVAHPSAMRQGAALEPRARAATVAPVDGLSKKKWAKGHFDVFPLPLLAIIANDNGFTIEERAWGALLTLAAPVETDQLDVTQRVACLSPTGIHLLLQRIVHADTRFPVREDTLARTFAPKLEELEMLQTWNEELVAPAVDGGAELGAELAKAAVDFEETMTQPHGEMCLRARLESGVRAGEAQRLLAQEIKARRR